MPKLTSEMTDCLLNEFGLRSFRDVADADYIAARLAYRAELPLQAFWASQQALEKYLKGILLFRRIESTKATHSLTDLLARLEAKFPLNITAQTRGFVTLIDEWNVDRYFTFPYVGDGDELFKLDAAVWDIRRYCFSIDKRISPNGIPCNETDLRNARSAKNRPPQLFRARQIGAIERVLETKGPAYQGLTWKNLFYGNSKRKSVRYRQKHVSHNSPLSLYPEIADELRKFVYLPGSRSSIK